MEFEFTDSQHWNARCDQYLGKKKVYAWGKGGVWQVMRDVCAAGVVLQVLIGWSGKASLRKWPLGCDLNQVNRNRVANWKKSY